MLSAPVWTLLNGGLERAQTVASLFGNNATYSAQKPTVSVNVPPAIQFADPGCLSFNGTSNSVKIPNSARYAVSATDSFSISAWAFLAAIPTNWMAVFGHEDITVTCGIWINPFGQWDWNGTSVPATTGWHHVVAVQDVSQNRRDFYLDGVFYPGALSAQNCDNGKPYFIGSGDGTDDHWNGRIDDVRFYSGVLTAAEVANLFAGN